MRAAQPTMQGLRTMVVENPDSVLSVLDEMERAGQEVLPSYQINLLRGLAYNEKRMFSLVERYVGMVLESDSIEAHPAERLNALTMMAVARAFFGDYQGSIKSSTEAMELARAAGNTAAQFNILTTMAKTSFSMGNREQGYRYIDMVISQGEESDEVRVLANVSAAYGVKIVELYADDRFEEGLAEGRRRLALIDRIERVGGSPQGYTDQQRAYAYARIASCALRAGRSAEAAGAYDDFMATDYARSPVGRMYIMDYLLDSGRWNTVLEFTAPLYGMFEGSDTINGDYESLLISDARAQSGLGNYRAGYGLMQRAYAVRDSLYMREKSTRAQELAAAFESNVREMELAGVRAELQRRKVMVIAAWGIGVLVLIILALIVRAYRQSVKRNKIAARQIDELLAMHGMNAAASDEDKESFRQFAEMQRMVTDGLLFKSQDFNRESIMEITGFTRSKVVHLIEKFAGMSPNDYINKLRVEYSARLINEHPEWTIDAIAEECGYVRRATYYSHFNKVFGITPAQYRKERATS